MSYSFHNTRRHQNKQERFHSRSISAKRTSNDDFSQKNSSRNFQNDSRQAKGGPTTSRHQNANKKQTSHQQYSKKTKNHANQTSNPINPKQNFSNSTQPRKFNQKKRQELHIKKPLQEDNKQLPEAQNIDSIPNINILGKREHQHENSVIKANIDLEIEEIEQPTLKKKRKVDELESVKTADSISTFSEPDANIISDNSQKIRKISEAFSGLKQKVDELEKNLSPETKENVQKILNKNSELSFKERLSNVINFFQTFNLN